MTAAAATTLGGRLRTARKSAGMSIEVLASVSGVAIGTISGAENDKTVPHTDKLVALADALGAPVDYLATGRAAPASSAAAGQTDNPLQLVSWEKLAVWAGNARRAPDAAAVADRAVSIKAHGLDQPLLGRPHPSDPDAVEIVAGQIRLRAIEQLIYEDDWPLDRPVPVIVRPMTDAEALEVSLVENVDRTPLPAPDKAEGYRILRDRHGRRPSQIARAMGETKQHVNRLIALDTGLPDSVKASWRAGDLSTAQCEAILDHGARLRALGQAVTDDEVATQQRTAGHVAVKNPAAYGTEAALRALLAEWYNEWVAQAALGAEDHSETNVPAPPPAPGLALSAAGSAEEGGSDHPVPAEPAERGGGNGVSGTAPAFPTRATPDDAFDFPKIPESLRRSPQPEPDAPAPARADAPREAPDPSPGQADGLSHAAPGGDPSAAPSEAPIGAKEGTPSAGTAQPEAASEPAPADGDFLLHLYRRGDTRPAASAHLTEKALDRFLRANQLPLDAGDVVSILVDRIERTAAADEAEDAA